MRLVVLIPVYSNQAGLDKTLSSLAGAEGAFDVVIVDDGSPRPIQAPSRLQDDVAVSVLTLPTNSGIARALNHGLQRILEQEYRYVGRLDAGDTVAAGRFDQQIRFLDVHPSCAAVSSFVDFVDRNQATLFRYRAPCDHSGILKRLHLNNCLVHSGSMMRTSVLREVGPYREDVRGAEDYELFLRMARHYELAVLPEVLTRCEYSTSGLTVMGRRRQQRERLRLQLRYFDIASWHSFYGVARTLAAMLTPHPVVFHLKRMRLH